MSPRSVGAAVFCFALLLAPTAARADVRLDVTTDRTSLSIEESLTLQVNVQSQGSEAADVSIPEFDGFVVLSQQVQRPMQFSFSFGARANIQSSSIYTFVLRPVRGGVLMIPAVRAELDGKVRVSKPIQISVTGGQAAAQNPQSSNDGTQQQAAAAGQSSDRAQIDPVAFLRQVADKTTPYQGEQVTITIYLYVRQQLQAAPEIVNEPTTDGVWVHDLLPASRSLEAGRQVVGDTVYAVYVLRRFAAFPLRSGELTIGPMTLQIDNSTVFDIFNPGRRGERLTRAGLPIVLRVKPLPDAHRPAGNIAVGRFTVSAKLDRHQVVTGDALTLTATVHGDGNVRSGEITMPTLANVDVLQPEIKDLVESPNDLVGGTREYRWLLVPRAPGRVTLPALVLQTFDPRGETYQAATSEALSFDVVGAALAATADKTGGKPDADAADRTPDQRPTHTWAPIRTQSALVRAYRPLFAEPWFAWANAAPFALWLSVVSSALLRRKLAARKLSGKGHAQREAEQRLRDAESAASSGDVPRFHAEASAAMLAVLGARLDETLTGLTRIQLRELLRARGVAPDLISDLIAALDRSEMARFSAAHESPSELTTEVADARALWKRLAAVGPAVDPSQPERSA